MKSIKLIITTLLLAAAMQASAGKLAGKNIILVQGFQFQHVFISRTHDEGKRFAYNYWNRFGLFNNGNGAVKVSRPTGITLLDQNLPSLVDAQGKKFNIYDTSKEPVYYNDANAKILHYDSTYRLEEPNGQGNGVKIAKQINKIFADDPNYCARTNGCIVVTHSTGDLVMQYIEANKATLLDSNARSKFDVLSYVDLAGARGGTEGATVLYELANLLNRIASKTVLSFSKRTEINIANNWLNLLFGSQGVEYLAPGKHLQSGILYNLQATVARSINLANPDQIPHLRVASAGNEPYGFITHLFIKGSDDSVVPLHSSCGSSQARSYNSCVRNRSLDGRKTWFANAPQSFYGYHFPFIQSKSLRHNGHQWDDKGNRMTQLITSANVANDVDINIRTKTSGNFFTGKYERIRDAERKTLSQVLTSSLR